MRFHDNQAKYTIWRVLTYFVVAALLAFGLWLAIAPEKYLAANRWWNRKLRRTLPHRIYTTPGERWARRWNQPTTWYVWSLRIAGVLMTGIAVLYAILLRYRTLRPYLSRPALTKLCAPAYETWGFIASDTCQTNRYILRAIARTG